MQRGADLSSVRLRVPGRPRRRWVLVLVLAAVLSLLGGYGSAAGVPSDPPGEDLPFLPGAAGFGDPYFPRDGNGGYDVQHYFLDLRYTPSTKMLRGTATITARATQNLSQFNLDLVGLTVSSVAVDTLDATFRRSRGELVVSPSAGVPDGQLFTTVVRYSGVPRALREPLPSDRATGFLPSKTGALFAGEPHVASRWFPVNDSLQDKATYTVRATVPKGLTALAGGVLSGRSTSKGWTTWKWDATEPMVPYLASLTIGKFDLKSYRKDGVLFWDAVDSALVDRVGPRSGSRYALSGRRGEAYQRLIRKIKVPKKGSRLSFWAARDFPGGGTALFVEAHTAGKNDWTTLRDANGHTSGTTDRNCNGLLQTHAFLVHYLKLQKNGTCKNTGTTAKPGRWWAATGSDKAYQHWSVDLSPYAGKTVEVAITYLSTYEDPATGAFVDDIVVSKGLGSTSFEADGNTLDGWRYAGPPRGTFGKSRWATGRIGDSPSTVGESAMADLSKGANVLNFLSERFGPYPFSSAGGVVHTFPYGGALENQTRPTYAYGIFGGDHGTEIMVHELAHQWFGGSVSPATWRDIWLNEGFATYAEWMWGERRYPEAAQDAFDANYARSAKNPFWKIEIGDPGRDHLFDTAVYDRGAMTLHQLRLRVGRRGVLPDPDRVDGHLAGRQRHHRRVRRARRGRVRPRPRRVLHVVAVLDGQARALGSLGFCLDRHLGGRGLALAGEVLERADRGGSPSRRRSDRSAGTARRVRRRCAWRGSSSARARAWRPCRSRRARPESRPRPRSRRPRRSGSCGTRPGGARCRTRCTARSDAASGGSRTARSCPASRWSRPSRATPGTAPRSRSRSRASRRRPCAGRGSRRARPPRRS